MLEAAVLAALAPRGLGERVRLRVAGGYTALQVWERLPTAVTDALGDAQVPDAPGGDAAPVAARRGIERVQRVLLALAERGRVRRARVGMTVPLNTKGPRDVLVDVFRLAPAGLGTR